MPYFIYKIHPGKTLEHVTSFDVFKEAKEHAMSMRAAQEAGDNFTVRVIFAKNTQEAQHLMKTERPFEVIGEE